LKKYYFLREDLFELENRINKLRSKVKDLGTEQGEANRQSTENFGHDDACQEAIYQERVVTLSRLNDLILMLNGAVVIDPKGPFDKVRFGSIVELSNRKRLRIGSYSIFAEHPIHTVSYNSPVGLALIGKAEGNEVELFGQKLTIVKIT